MFSPILRLATCFLLISCDSGPSSQDADYDTSDIDSNTEDSDREDISPCPDDMALVDDGLVTPFCIDLYEYPNSAGQEVTVGLAWFEAREVCAEAQKEICTEQRWVAACTGSTAPTCQGTLGPSGVREKCISDFGVFDMAGNASEWTATPGTSVTFWVLGGSADDDLIGCDVREEVEADYRNTFRGFRCCRAARR